jgi:hypothetical protein
VDEQDADYIAELPLIAAGWDEAVAEVQAAQQRKNSPGPGGKRRRLFGAGGMNA